MNEAKTWQQQFEEWVEDLCPYGNEPLRYVQWGYKDGEVIGVPVRQRAKIFTGCNVYTISATEKYLGCIVSARMPRAGETWTRGKDLPDGKFSEETWQKIVLAIVRYELVELDVEAADVVAEGVSISAPV